MIQPGHQILLLDETFFDNPWRLYDRLRQEDVSLHRIKLPNGLLAWLVIDHALGKEILSDPRLSRDAQSACRAALTQGIGKDWQSGSGHKPWLISLLNSDPPDHTRLRSMVATMFTPVASARMQPIIKQVAAELVQGLIVSASAASINLIARYAAPLPMMVISRLLGVPVADRDQFDSLVLTIMDESAFADGMSGQLALIELGNYLSDLVAIRRSDEHPGEGDETRRAVDFLDTLIAAQFDQQGLTDAELIYHVALMLIAGYDTTVHLIANAAHALASNPALRRQINAKPAGTESLIEEVLRHDGPGHTTTLRHTTSPITVAGTTIGTGEFLLVSLAAANRDPAAFPEANRFKIERNGLTHLGFGHGIHHCVGAPLARLESTIAIRALVAAFPNFTLAVDPAALKWRRSLQVHGYLRLPITLHGCNPPLPQIDR
ncbi:cytochrome P450 [Mycobacterium sp. CBMA271]|uniref:cytochrome P450 family protein n=1 Tax=unclassified Mycobacteroides TaxID=2618759 RepID=UPI0012DCF61D|nr:MULTISPECIES: cytochrome P450 [unclassified Mycobacteroides]MUM16071.1 hypothetical protein [Mycobacteroides sp. CBMA 326]MUM22430.1 cytochrome P450 [Mycobacteroides sp. CBMA 271]